MPIQRRVEDQRFHRDVARRGGRSLQAQHLVRCDGGPAVCFGPSSCQFVMRRILAILHLPTSIQKLPLSSSRHFDDVLRGVYPAD